MRGRGRKVREEAAVAACGSHHRGAVSQAQTKEQNPSKGEVSGKEPAPEQQLDFSGWGLLWFCLLSVFCTQTKEKCDVHKTRKYLCPFLCIYARFQSDACTFPHPSQDLSPMNEEAWEIRMTLTCLCGIAQEGQGWPLWLA